MIVDRDRLTAVLPAYEIRDEIGHGAWGVVLRGEHRGLQLPVAIRVLRADVAGDPGVHARFATEARVLGSLDHPHIVRILDYVDQGDLCLFVMELLPGGSVRDRIASGGVTAEAACGLAIATASALGHAHRIGVLHRDIKPENLMFSATGTMRVADFGIAKVLGGSTAAMTRAGELFGTAPYMAPEQVLGRQLAPATDVYALSTVLYELLSGQFPFPLDENPMTTLHRHVQDAPAPLRTVAPWVPAGLAAAVMQGLATDPAARTPDAEEFGVSIADAAGRAWGPGWVERGGVELVTSGRITAHLGPPRGGAADRTKRGSGRSETGGAAARRGRMQRALVLGGIALAAVVAAVIVLARHGGSGLAVTPGAPPAPTAAPSATAAADSHTVTTTATGTGRVVLADDAMNDPTSGWAPDPAQEANGTAAFHTDGYHVTSLKPNPAPLTTYSVASPFALRLTSLIVSVDAVMAGSPADGAGVRCDQGGGRSALRYTFEVHGDGTWVIFRIDEKGSAAGLAQGASPAIRPVGQANTIQGRCDEQPAGTTSLTMTVNGTPLGTTADTHGGAAISWHAALVLYRDPQSPSTEVRFTRFQLRDGGG